ncbi:MAG: NAD(P)-binding protein [Solirubrobacterales bacterium]|nr:NAD(P)-binding protein [Solirubrobacterales bacterium]
MERVAIIGAGLSGICAAARLREAGIEDFVILDRGEEHRRYRGLGGPVRSRDRRRGGTPDRLPAHRPLGSAEARSPDLRIRAEPLPPFPVHPAARAGPDLQSDRTLQPGDAPPAGDEPVPAAR